jgi:hypothetical protein
MNIIRPNSAINARHNMMLRRLGRIFGLPNMVCRIVSIIVLLVFMISCAQIHRRPGADSDRVVNVTASQLPFERQFKMKEGDSHVFRLPDGKTVAVWCWRPAFPMNVGLAEQTTASGLKTEWGEKPFKRPKPVYEQLGSNSYTISGWQSYISSEGVETIGNQTSEYKLDVGDLHFSIIENLQATDLFPVTIKIQR